MVSGAVCGCILEQTQSTNLWYSQILPLTFFLFGKEIVIKKAETRKKIEKGGANTIKILFFPLVMLPG